MTSENTINQRLKALIEALKMNPRSFSRMARVSEGTTRSYLDRGSKPNSEYISAISVAIANLNTRWFLTGEGEMFLAGDGKPHITSHNNSGNNVGHNSGGSVTQLQNVGNSPPTPPGNCEQQLEAANREIQLLRQQSMDKERIIQLLEAQINKN